MKIRMKVCDSTTMDNGWRRISFKTTEDEPRLIRVPYIYLDVPPADEALYTIGFEQDVEVTLA